MSEPDFERDLTGREREASQTVYTRPVRDILREVADSFTGNTAVTRSFIVFVLLPWINTKAVANKDQERAIKDLSWYSWSRQEVECVPQLITMFNTLRG